MGGYWSEMLMVVFEVNVDVDVDFFASFIWILLFIVLKCDIN